MAMLATKLLAEKWALSGIVSVINRSLDQFVHYIIKLLTFRGHKLGKLIGLQSGRPGKDMSMKILMARVVILSIL